MKQNKLIKWMRQNTVALMAMFSVCLVGAIGVAAYSGGQGSVVMEGPVNIEKLVIGGGESFGAASFIASASGFTDVNITNDLDVDGDAEVNGTLQVDSSFTLSGELQASTIISGGSVLSTSTAATGVTDVLTAAQICDNSVILYTPNATGGVALTLPATSTLFADCLNTDGDSKSVLLKNVTSTAEADIILTAGTGNVLVGSPTTTAATQDNVEEDSYTRMIFTRLGDAVGNVLVELVNFNDSD